MGRRRNRGWLPLAALAAGFGMLPGRADAQFGFGGGAPPAATAGGANGSATGATSPYGGTAWSGMALNPLMNPYVNPYTNPLAAAAQPGQQGMSPGTAALYYMAAQQMNGGLGSGRLGGPYAAGATAGSGPGRPAGRTVGRWDRSTQARGASPSPAARTGGANSPGGKAARFFDQNYPTSTGWSRYYSRQNTHFPFPGK